MEQAQRSREKTTPGAGFGPPTLKRLTTRTRYAVQQTSRVALYKLHYEAMRRMNLRLAKDLPQSETPVPDGPVPGPRRMLEDIAQLFAQDLKSVEAGHYPMPRDGTMTPRALLATSLAFFRDVPKVARRRAEDAHQEVNEDREGFAGSLPRYYRQNFHFQTDGWLSEESARIYDFQVDVLFSGATGAMRRRALLPLSELVKRQDQRTIRYVDLACGTGGLLGPALSAFPRLKVIGVDLSEPYLGFARQRLRTPRASFVTAAAENLPFDDNSIDVISCVFLFHELPPKIRRLAFSEVARVLKPGGMFLFVDSLQTGDVPDYDGLLSLFPQLFHEPYYTSYLTEDFAAIGHDTGLRQVSAEPAFVSRVVRFVKDPDLTAAA
ncbi:class I SAM-dependent methyltransferase [Roseibium sp. RKSG952]|uniref:class I SAM-dependent methyltransferase n=1 Tax=Roseibium sp. RKSG952 TaxID=2529384 RepID=UPI0012BD3CAD|nr:class I SAM-dependent methyltransferase [Roseibium sp. RKSG952]MTH96305.1 class I SAM-dependent methyltransferase [Roseibium sp. RKSG952]